MTVYDTVLRISLEKPLVKATIRNPFIEKPLYSGPFQDIPKSLFDRPVTARAYEYTTKDIILWVRA